MVDRKKRNFFAESLDFFGWLRYDSICLKVRFRTEKRAAETCHSFRPRLAPGGA